MGVGVNPCSPGTPQSICCMDGASKDVMISDAGLGSPVAREAGTADVIIMGRADVVYGGWGSRGVIL